MNINPKLQVLKIQGFVPKFLNVLSIKMALKRVISSLQISTTLLVLIYTQLELQQEVYLIDDEVSLYCIILLCIILLLR
jgi:hypothetical protein